MMLPAAVKIVEVGPRDGFQNINGWIDTRDKVDIVLALQSAGVDELEVGSFISPKAIPQMRDIEEILDAIDGRGVHERIIALIANKKGADRAVAAGVGKVTLVISASEAHNQANVGRSCAQSLEELESIWLEYPQLQVKLSVATAFGCPYRGEVPLDDIHRLIGKAHDLGMERVCLCDTIGVASPLLVERTLDDLLGRYQGAGIEWSMHLHNTRGLAAANTYAALRQGISQFETSIAGLGGCPFAPGASGNMATEDLVYLLQDMGIRVGADLDRVLDASKLVTQRLGVPSDSKINRVTRHKVPAPREHGEKGAG